MINWEKKGLLIETGDLGYTHASHPSMIHLDNDIFLLAFSSRLNQQANIFLAHAEIKNEKIKLISKPQLALKPSEPGYFDSEGLLNCCFVKYDKKIYIYYSGWQNIQQGFWHCDTGRAVADPDKLTAKREFNGPVMGRDKYNPIFAAATSVHVDENGNWKSWYNSGISWEKREKGWHPKYGIHYATSKDGLNWSYRPGLIIPLKEEYEHSFGRPSVVKWDGKYQMWFSHRGTKEYSTYRIGYALSSDGINWKREDSKSGITISDTGWDNESICYPYLIEHKNIKYMLYSGNKYGLTGSGYAIGRND